MRISAITFMCFLVVGCASKGTSSDQSTDGEPIATDTRTSSSDTNPGVKDTKTPPKDSQLPKDTEATETVDTQRADNPAQGEHELTACQGPTGTEQSCFWTHRYDPAKCANGCKRLVIYYAGGLMTSPDPADATSYLGKYSDFGYVAVCARLFENAEGAGSLPYTLEADRVDMLLQAITSDPVIQKAWTGDHLLITGASHGATAPVATMFRTALDEKPYWHGKKLTAACFLDGVYDVPAAMKLLYDNQCTSPVSYERMYSRYCEWTGGEKPASWPKPDSCTAPSIDTDTVVNADPADLAIKHWKLIECGSSTAPCTGDIFPKEPIELLCSRIDGNKDANCEYKSYKNSSHVTCGITLTNYGVCRQWFGDLIQAL